MIRWQLGQGPGALPGETARQLAALPNVSGILKVEKLARVTHKRIGHDLTASEDSVLAV